MYKAAKNICGDRSTHCYILHIVVSGIVKHILNIMMEWSDTTKVFSTVTKSTPTITGYGNEILRAYQHCYKWVQIAGQVGGSKTTRSLPTKEEQLLALMRRGGSMSTRGSARWRNSARSSRHQTTPKQWSAPESQATLAAEAFPRRHRRPLCGLQRRASGPLLRWTLKGRAWILA